MRVASENRDAYKLKRKNIRPDLVAKVLNKDTDLLPVQTIYDVKNVFSVKVNYICPDQLYAVKKCDNKTKSASSLPIFSFLVGGGWLGRGLLQP